MSLITKKLPNFFILEISVTSYVYLPFSPMSFLICAACCKVIKSGSTFFDSLKEF